MFFVVVLLLTTVARAELDPSTALLLRGPAPAPAVETLDPDVYFVRPARALRTPPAAELPPPPEAEEAAPAPTLPPIADRAPAAVREEHALALELNVQAGYFVLNSTAADPARSFGINGAGAGLGLDLWLTPRFALTGVYLTSVAADADLQLLDFGARLKREAGDVRFEFGPGYRETVVAFRDGSPDQGARTRWLDLAGAVEWMQDVDYVHRAELHLRPALGGVSAEVGFGGRWGREDGARLIWSVDYQWERYGIDRVTVTSGLALIRLGAEWGS